MLEQANADAAQSIGQHRYRPAQTKRLQFHWWLKRPLSGWTDRLAGQIDKLPQVPMDVHELAKLAKLEEKNCISLQASVAGQLVGSQASFSA